MMLGTVFCQYLVSFLLAQAIALHSPFLNVLWLVVVLNQGMAESTQDALRSAWLDAKEGSLSGKEQAKAWAMREIWRDADKAEHGMKTYIAGKLKKQGGGAPSSEAVR
jgi:hypothetical protein